MKELAKQEGISINQLAVTALSEKIAALMTAEYLEKRAARASRQVFEQALARVKDIEPDPEDRL